MTAPEEHADMGKGPIVNCHVHIFTGDHVPAHLAKSIVPWPLYYLINIRWILALMIRLKKLFRFRYTPGWRTFIVRVKTFKAFIAHRRVLALIRWLFHVWLTLNVFHFLLGLLIRWGVVEQATIDEPRIKQVLDFLIDHGVLWNRLSPFVLTVLTLYVWAFVPSARRLILQGLSFFWKALGALPSTKVKELWDRYKLIIRFSLYGVDKEENAKGRSGQSSVFTKLRHQYPKDAHFVVLPMDMEYMGAGPVARNGRFANQMNELMELKASAEYGDRLHPFIFIDPRRIKEEGRAFFDWGVGANGEVQLKECSIKRYLDAGFSGFKIYPALGYYVFDEHLLPLWLYAAQQGLPIMTHCIRGVIYYRGRKEAEWDAHPIFQRQSRAADEGDATRESARYEPLDLLQTSNETFSWNFTHPLNYLCLLNRDLLREHFRRLDQKYGQPRNAAGRIQYDRIRQLFLSDTPGAPLKADLSALKICLAHFGGEDEWYRHMESDTDDFNQQLITRPEHGLDFELVKDGTIQWNRLYRHWHEADWYSIICSLILAYPNVYADISYIVHVQGIQPLLLKTLEHPTGRLRDRVLFGTDFYVVRNHNSDKELLANIMYGLSEEHFDLIARTNPITYLSRKNPLPTTPNP